MGVVYDFFAGAMQVFGIATRLYRKLLSTAPCIRGAAWFLRFILYSLCVRLLEFSKLGLGF